MIEAVLVTVFIVLLIAMWLIDAGREDAPYDDM
jgi:hypothetical protein